MSLVKKLLLYFLRAPIKVDIALAVKQLQENPALGKLMMDIVGGPLLVESERRVEHLQAALSLAVDMLAPHEPPDSRAVSDQFVALAACAAGHFDDEVMAVINRGLSNGSD